MLSGTAAGSLDSAPRIVAAATCRDAVDGLESAHEVCAVREGLLRIVEEFDDDEIGIRAGIEPDGPGHPGAELLHALRRFFGERQRRLLWIPAQLLSRPDPDRKRAVRPRLAEKQVDAIQQRTDVVPRLDDSR